MKITGLDKEIGEILGNGFYSIPRYQRPYSWMPDHIQEFWTDTIADNDSDYFIGSMVVFKDKSTNRYEIVDGQQRMTTITMILAALRDAFKTAGLEDLATGTHRLVERADLANRPQFVLDTETSYPYLQDQIQRFGPPQTKGPVSKEEQMLARSYATVRDRIAETVFETKSNVSTEKLIRPAVEKALTKIRDKVLSLKLILVEVDNEEDAYGIFETLNARGQELGISDLFKAHLTKLIRPKNPKLDLAKDQWNKIREVIAGSPANIDINIFLHHFWLSQYEYAPLKKLYPKFRRVVTRENAVAVLQSIKDDALTYREIVEPGFRKWDKQEAPIRDALIALSLFRVTQPLPMVLAIMREYRSGRLSGKQVRSALQVIERFHFLGGAVVGQRSSGGISGMYASHARQLTGAGSLQKRQEVLQNLQQKLRERAPSFAEFEVAFSEIRYSDLYTKQKKLVQYILSRLDGAHQEGVRVDYEQMTIEHLASQKPKGDETANREEVAQLGNLLLVTEALNNELSNKNFQDKQAILRGSKAWVDKSILTAADWTGQEIQERTRELARIAYRSIWRL